MSFTPEQQQCLTLRSNRWSSVPNSSDNAWNYNNNGMSNNNGFTNELAVRPVSNFELKANLNMDLENLYTAYMASRKHNKRSEDMVFFEIDLYANLSRLCERINSGSYVPLHNYSFIHRRGSTPREVFAAEPELKTMMAFALTRISPLIENHLSDRTFNNRVGMGAQLAVNTLINDIYEVSEGYTKPCWIIKTDYKGYFPNMNRDTAFRQFMDIVNNEYHGRDKDDVIYCLATACFTAPERSRRKSALWEWADYPDYKSVYKRPDGIGGFIGYTSWRTVASLYPTEIDRFVEENISRHFVRYVDDTVIVTDNKEMVLAQFPEYRRRLHAIGITMHPHKFYCQPYEHGVEFLGYHILPGRVHPKRRTVERARTVAKDRARGRRKFIASMNSYLGIIKATSDLKAVTEILDSITRKSIHKDYSNFKIS